VAGEGWTSTAITGPCVFDLDSKANGLPLIELAPGVTLVEIRAKTDADFNPGAFT